MSDVSEIPAYYYTSSPVPPGLSAKNGNDQKLKEACTEFEAIFIKQMLNSMKKTVQKTGLMDGGFAEEIFDDMLYDEYALEIARSSSMGLADLLYKQLSEI